MQNETMLASAVKVTAVNTGAAVSMITNTGAISAIAGTLAATYSAIQIIKALPWMTEYVIAVKVGITTHDWSRWRRIGRKEEKYDGDNS